MTAYTFDNDIVSDLHKDAFGFRPSQGFWINWTAMSDDEKQVEWDSLIVALEQTVEEDNRREQDSIIKFNILVDAVLATGAKTKADAVRWLMDSANVDNDDQYFDFTMGVPYGYTKNLLSAT